LAHVQRVREPPEVAGRVGHQPSQDLERPHESHAQKQLQIQQKPT